MFCMLCSLEYKLNQNETDNTICCPVIFVKLYFVSDVINSLRATLPDLKKFMTY